jgi:hypothetical protein
MYPLVLVGYVVDDTIPKAIGMNIEVMFIFWRTNMSYLSKNRIFHNVVTSSKSNF